MPFLPAFSILDSYEMKNLNLAMIHIFSGFKSLKLVCRFFSRFMKWNWRPLSLNPPFLIPAICNIGILIHKQATLSKHFEPQCITVLPYKFYGNFWYKTEILFSLNWHKLALVYNWRKPKSASFFLAETYYIHKSRCISRIGIE